MRSNKSSNLFALLCLIGTVWTAVATSTSNGTYGTYNVKSDCVSPVFNQSVTISSSAISFPSGVNFTTLGFPTNSLSVGAVNSGVLNGKTRVCETALSNSNTFNDTFLYSCSDNGAFTCNIYFEEY